MKTVEQLAREAGYPEAILELSPKALQRFHDLAIAQYRESLLAGVGEVKNDLTRAINTYAMLTACATPQETKDAERKLSDALDKQLAAAVAIERERCAKVCDIETSANVTNANEAYQEGRAMGAAVCAAAIRGQL